MPARLTLRVVKLWQTGLVLGLLLSSCLYVPVAFAERDPHFKELLVTVVINQRPQSGVSLVLQDRYNQLFINREDLEHWHIRFPALPPILFKNNAYYRLGDFGQARSAFERSRMRLYIDFPVQMFKSHDVQVPIPRIQAQRPQQLGAYMNYDVSIPSFPIKTSVNGVFEGGLFHRLGVLSGQMLGQDLARNAHAIRLNTTYTYDNPENVTTLRVGDTVNHPGMWGGVVSMGGIQFGTNFATQPDFITYPLPPLIGQAVIPSVVDLYVNNALILQRDVNPGPFAIDSLPVVNGRGDISVVTKDLLGREQILTVPYYTSSNLLKPGLTDYSFEVGVVRENYGIKSNDYHELLGVATLRRGVNAYLTTEFHAEARGRQQALGIGSSVLCSTYGIMDTAIVASNSSIGQGFLALWAFDHQAPRFNASASFRYASKHFLQLGWTPENRPPTLESQVFVGFPLPRRSTLGMSFISRLRRDQPNTNFLSANVSTTIFHDWMLSLSALTNVGGERSRAVFVSVTTVLDKHTSLTLNANKQTELNQLGAQINRNPDTEYGLSYYLAGQAGQGSNLQGGASWQHQHGMLSVQGVHQDGESDFRIDTNGGITYFAGEWFLSRPITNSFGVVQVPGYKGLGVFLDNQLVAHTNNKGYALIPDLRAYTDNQVSIDGRELPLDAQVRKLTLHAVPYFHSGLLLNFAIKPNRGGILRLRQQNGLWVPVGAKLHYADGKRHEWVGYDGEVYVVDLQPTNHFVVEWPEGHCEFDLSYAPSGDPLPDMGEHHCLSQTVNTHSQR